MNNICAKEFLHSNFIYAVIAKISIFEEIAPNFTYWHIGIILHQLLLPYKFYGIGMPGIYFFTFDSREPLNSTAFIFLSFLTDKMTFERLLCKNGNESQKWE